MAVRVGRLYPLLRTIGNAVVVVLLLGGLTNFLYEWFREGTRPELRALSTSSWILSIALILAALIVLLMTLWARANHLKLIHESKFRLAKPASQLTAGDLHFEPWCPRKHRSFDRRPFVDQYVPRSIVAEGGFGPTWHEQEVADQIGERQSVVLLGEPTDGKTRTLYDIVHRLPDHHVVVPIIDQPTPEPDAFKILAGRRVILMLDNLTDFVDAAVDLTTFCNRLGSVADYVVVATCRDGPEHGRVRDGFRGGLRTLYERIPLKLRLEPLNADDKRTLAESADIDWDPAREALYPTPGSIIMADALSAMTGRFDQLAIGPRTVVLAIALLDYAGIAPVTRKRVAAVVCDVFGQAVNLDDGLNQLADSSFIGKPANRDPILPEPAYIRPPVVNYAEHRTGGPRGDFDALADSLSTHSDAAGLFYLSTVLDSKTEHDRLRIVNCLDKSLAIDPNIPEALYNKGVALDNLGRYEEEITAYDAALALRAEYPEALNNKGVALGNLGRYEEAITANDAALALRAEYPEALYNKGVALGNLGRHEEAITAYDAALALRTDPEALNNKGVALCNLGRYEEAIIYFDKVLELRSDMPQVFCNKAVAFELLGRLDDANDCFATAAELGFDCGRGDDGSSASSVSTDR